jgi:hypothetical protein
MILRLLAIAIAVAFSGGQRTKPPASPPVLPDYDPVVLRNQKQFTFLPGGKVSVSLALAGSCRIIGWQSSSVRLESEQIAYQVTPEQARVLLQQYPVESRWTQTTATIHVDGPPTTFASLEANLTLYIPKERTDVTVKLMKGDLQVGGIGGWVEATLQEGSIDATSLSGYFSALTKRGDIRAALTGKRWFGHSFTAVTMKGSVELILPADYSAALQLETLEGDLKLDFPPQVVDGEETQLQVVRKKKGRSLAAAVGDGGSPVLMRTQSGDVHLSVARDQK